MNAVSVAPGLMLPLQQVAVCTLPVTQSKYRSTAIASGAALKASARARYFSSGLVENKKRSRGATEHGLPAARRSCAGAENREFILALLQLLLLTLGLARAAGFCAR